MSKNRIVLPYPADDHDHHDDLNNLGLQADAGMMNRSVIDRRRMLGLGLLGGIALLTACNTDSTDSTGTGTGTGTGTTTGSCTTIPTETQGPYPADGSNSASQTSGQTTNALSISGIQRTNLIKSAGTGNSAVGIPLSVTLQLVNVNASCAALSGYAVYMWHCTADGQYSMYSSSIIGEDYLRGVAATDSSGNVTFSTIFPGCYSGRWPHIHFEVYPTLAKATSYSNKIQTSQLAMPEAAARAVYATSNYTSSLSNLNQISLSTDNVFSDDSAAHQLPSITGSVSAGYAATLVVGLSI